MKQLCMMTCGNLATDGCEIVRGRKKYLLCRLHFNIMTGRDPRHEWGRLQQERGIKLRDERFCKRCKAIDQEWANADYCTHCWEHRLTPGYKKRYSK